MQLKRFDIVIIKTIKNVQWLSGPASRPASPQGRWSVVAGVEGVKKIMLAKDETLCIIPIDDIIKVADFGPEYAMKSIKKVRNHADLKKTKFGRTQDGEDKTRENG